MSDVQIYSRVPELFQKLRDQPFNPQDYFAQGDNLHIRLWGSMTANVAFHYQTLDPSGRVVTNAHFLTPPTDRSSTALFFDMPECILLGFLVNVEAQEVPRGAIFASVQSRKSAISAGGAHRHLAHGYIDGTFSLQYPFPQSHPAFSGYGRPRVIVGTDPAAGVEISETVPTNAMWRLRSVQMTLVTDATVAARTPHLVIDDGTDIQQRIPSNAGISASTTQPVCWCPIGDDTPSSTGAHGAPHPMNLFLPPGSRVRTLTSNLQAGDDWGAPVLSVEEWLVEA